MTNPITLASLAPVAPEIFLLTVGCIILVAGVLVREPARAVLFPLSLIGLVGCALLTMQELAQPTRIVFSGTIITDLLARITKLALYAAVFVTLIYSRDYLKRKKLLTPEFLALALFATLGMMVMISAHHFVTLYIGLELLALSLYAMVALERDSAFATEAAMKYFVLGALASGLLLYGISMIYGATGSLDLAEVSRIIGAAQHNQTLLLFGLVFVVAGLAFKLGAVPFHMWIPDVYHGAATPMTLFIGAAPKLAAFVFVLRILSQGLGDIVGEWQPMLVVLAVLSIGLGNIVAIAQTNLKRMLAYSTISHMGFMLLGILAGGEAGFSSAMFYVITYVLTTLLSFGMILLLARDGFEAENIDDFKGLNSRSRWHAFLMLVVMFSLAGIPPTVGFFGKLAVLKAALAAGYVWVVVFAVVLSVIGAFYYLRVVKVMYMDEPTDHSAISAGADMQALLSLNAIAVLALGIVPAPLLALCAKAVATAF